MKSKMVPTLIFMVLSLSWSQARGEPDALPSKATAYYKQLSENGYVLSLAPGAKLMASLKAFQKASGVKTASVTGLGVLKNIQLGQYRAIGDSLIDGGVAQPPRFPTHDDVFIKGHREVVSLVCNLTTSLLAQFGASPTDPHCHVALAGSDQPDLDSQSGYPVVGGHLVEAEVAVIGEIFITAYPVALNKQDGSVLGGTILNLDESQGGIPLN